MLICVRCCCLLCVLAYASGSYRAEGSSYAISDNIAAQPHLDAWRTVTKGYPGPDVAAWAVRGVVCMRSFFSSSA